MPSNEHIPGWTPYQLSDIYTERREPGNDTLPMLTVSIHDGVSDGELDDDELGKKVRRIADKTQYRVAKPGDLVFNMMRAWQGAIGVARSEGMVSPAYIVAKPNDKVYPLFMDYYMKAPRMVGIINRQSYGVTDFRKRLYWDSFAPINVMLPPIAEQKKIAAILTTQDKVIGLKEKRLAEKQRQKKYLMQQLLTGHIRLPGFSHKWESVKLCDIANKEKKKNTDFTYILVLSNSAQHGVVPQSEQFDKDIANKENIDGYYIVHNGFFVYNPRISVTAPCGPINVNETGVTGVMSPLYTVFSINDSCVSNEYLKYYFSSSAWYAYMNSIANYGARHDRMSVTDDDFFAMPIRLPSIHEQQAITRVLSTSAKEVLLLQHDLDQEKQKKKALMQLLLTGKVRVNI